MTLKLDPHNPLVTKVQTRDGRKARIICTDRIDEFYSIVGLVTTPTGREFVETWKPDGSISSSSPCYSDLINVPETKSWWVNLYEDDTPFGEFKSTRQAADHHKRKFEKRIGIIELRMCDGKLVDAIQHEVEK